jgi:hypothetical protein
VQPNIDDIIRQLEAIIQTCAAENNRAGYFAVLYHRVTCRIKEGITKSEFEDNARMERLDVLFAGRYLDAWNTWRAGRNTTGSWKVAFDAAANKDHLILQHLLLGINAHINLDLGIAAAETMKGYSLDGVKKDFDSINNILAALVDEVQDNLGKVSLLMPLFDRCTRGYDEKIVCFSINVAREGAWLFATELSGKAGQIYDDCIIVRDRSIAILGQNIITLKGNFLAFMLTIARLFESRGVGANINKLKYVVKEAADKT